jgi:cytochrome b
MSHLVRIWDLPTRFFHWSLASCFIALIFSAQLGFMDWHFRFGYVMMSLLLFRLIWGFVGGHWSRFSNFIFSPRTLLRYLRGHDAPQLSTGHTPLGAVSVFALLLFLLVQVGTGLISDDEIASSGPLSHLVGGDLVSLATTYHHKVGKLLLLGLVAVHVFAILFYLWRKRQNLILPMLIGDKHLDQPVTASRDDSHTRLLALLLLLCCAGLVILMLKFVPGV